MNSSPHLTAVPRRDCIHANSLLCLAVLCSLASIVTASGQPIITRQPTGQSLSLGATATFTVSATGTTPLSYQWQLNGVDLDDETKNRLVLTNLQLTDAGEYTVVVSNPEGAVTSQPVILDVDPTFTKITSDPIVTDTGYNWHGQAWGDYDADGDQDVLLLTDRRGYDPIYRNNGDGTFARVFEPGLQEGLDRGVNELDVFYSWADYDNDGDLDLFITTGGRFFETGPFRLYRNEGGGQFTSMSAEDAGPLVNEGSQSYSCAWGDYDNDGWIDLYVANGWRGADRRPDLLYRNKGDGTFTKITRGSPATELGAGMSANWVDIDNDGFLDLFTAKHPEPDNSLNRLYRNNGNSNNWLCVKCVGTVSPRWGTGAKVRVQATIAGKSMWQLRLIDAGGWSWGGQSFVAHFGLGDATVVHMLRIEWTSGLVQEFKDVAVNRYLTLTEPPKLQMSQPGELKVSCWQGQIIRIEHSSDLMTWTQLGTVTNLNSTGGVQWTDQNTPGSSVRFYRAITR